MSALPRLVESQTTYQETPSTILPAAPPRELDAAIDASAGRAAALAGLDRELNFVTGPGGELEVEVRDMAGNVLRVVSPSQAIAIMSGLGQI